MKKFDVVIVGGGPIGIACGLEAKKRGLSYLIIEKGPIVNSLFHYPSNMQFFSSSEKLEIDEIPFISKEPKPKRDEALEYYRRIVTSNHLNIHLFDIEIDGGVTATNAKALKDAGADVLVAGSFVFNSENPVETIQELKDIAG